MAVVSKPRPDDLDSPGQLFADILVGADRFVEQAVRRPPASERRAWHRRPWTPSVPMTIVRKG
jgi:hypothetical protein